jgi:hypothetical protein
MLWHEICINLKSRSYKHAEKIGIHGYRAYNSDRCIGYLKSAARDLYSNMQLAKLSAIKNNADWAIVFNKAADQYQVCSGQGPDNSWGGGDNIVIKTVVLNNYRSGVAYGHGNAGSAIGSTFGDEITLANNVAVMNSRGTGNAGYVYLENSSTTTSYGIGKRSNGLIVLRRWNGANWGN